MRRGYALCGGAFDPVHYGHLLLAECAREQLGLERVIFVPSARGPHRSEPPRAPARARLEMLQSAVADNPAFVVEDCELLRGGVSYTIDTVETLIGRYGPEITVLVGADNLAGLRSWHRVEELIGLVRFACAPRPGTPPEAPSPPPGTRCVELKMPLFDVSSTLLRRRLCQGESLRYLTPPAVISYIAEKRLYAGQG